MSTFLLIIKILPWVLSLAGGAYGFFKRKKVESLKDRLEVKNNSIKQLKDIVVSQGADIETKEKQISELMEINKKYETKKKSINNSKSATASMASKRP